ncbi:TetR/AcrR family transcriptional regulator [Microbacterium sp. ZXX196]|uniref:TetR/AcrR family transcriptional regulator n=1 Tax=Microbacterium sp. ZXX196 TaxID=2609291 RepID=UPI0012B6D9A8|nr:TetR/AcrR family transcriptional regulator [Microbacterium sp. ZXX196]MTE24644.1 TetR family transcriptional regulator [Microbacterium sp. ZXX196]
MRTAPTGRPGRPRAISRGMLAEAACELFLERGYDATTVGDIASRAGIARSSFFNYAAGKAELVWGALDERIAGLEAAIDRGASVAEALRGLADGFHPDQLALVLAQADAMRMADHVDLESAVRGYRIARVVARGLRAVGEDPLGAEVRGGAHGAAVLAALREWAHDGAGASAFATHLARATAYVPTR